MSATALRREIPAVLGLLLVASVLYSFHFIAHTHPTECGSPVGAAAPPVSWSAARGLWGRPQRANCPEDLPGQHTRRTLVGTTDGSNNDEDGHEENEGKPYAYAFYATEPQYLCSALTLATRLRQLNITEKADIVVLYPHFWVDKSGAGRGPDGSRTPDPGTATGALLASMPREVVLELRAIEASVRPDYLNGFNIRALLGKLVALGARVKPVKLLRSLSADKNYEKSLTKLRVFELTEYRRVVYIDGDGLILQNLDHLFSLPMGHIAMPRKYWHSQGAGAAPRFSTELMVLQPNEDLAKQVLLAAVESKGTDEDVLNGMFETVVPLENTYNMRVEEFRLTNHTAFLGQQSDTAWNAVKAFNDAFFLHFSDAPLPKPWIYPPMEDIKDAAPKCPPDCDELALWLSVYETFREQSQMCQG